MTARRFRDARGGNEAFLKALSLSDGAFKLYVWLRLNARLDAGSLEVSQMDIARALAKAPGTIRSKLKELEQAGVCRARFPRHSRARGWIEITDQYWPNERAAAGADDPGLRVYLDRIRNAMGQRACIRSALSAADELLARDWYARGVPAERIEQAVLLGCARKYVSWRNGAPRIVIGSLRYFEQILAELAAKDMPEEYWNYTRYRVERMERLWFNGERTAEATGGNPSEETQKGGCPDKHRRGIVDPGPIQRASTSGG